MKDTKIFYFDVDGTIFDNETQTVSLKTSQALSRLQENGYKVAMCTGRTLGAVKDTEIEDLLDWDAYILANGGIIMDKNLNMLENIKCEPKFILDLIKIYPEPIILEGDEIYMSKEINDSIKQFLFESKIVEPPTIDYKDEIIQKVILEDIDLIENGFDNPLFNDYDYHLNTANMYEIFPKDSGKHTAIAKFNKLNNLESYTYFGDGHNDVDSIRLANFGVAMGNAVDDAKNIADYVTDDVADEGIYNALKYHKVI